MKKRHYPMTFAMALLLAVSTAYLGSLSALPAQQPAADTLSELSVQRYMDHVAFLSRPEMRGRGNGSPELEQAAEYIAAQFRMWGLEPAGEMGTFFQTFEITTGTDFGAGNELVVDGTGRRMNEDFVPIAFSNNDDVEGPAVFAGFGITAPELDYDDYRDIDANGKIVVVLRHEPEELDPNSRFAGTNFTSHATFINKAINARRHGAKGIVFITDPNNHAREEDAVGPATRGAESSNVGLPSVHARRDAVMAMFEKAGRDLSAIQTRIDAELEPQSFDLPESRIRIATDVTRARRPVRNVIGAVRGSDPVLRDEWIVIGAHYDHVGLGERGAMAASQIGQIHHGADDNASGTSGMLELARRTSETRQSLKRSMLFMAFAAEEIGLLGSAHFVNNPTIPFNNVIGMINLDMIGRMTNDRLNVGGVGTARNFRSWLEEANRSLGLNLNYSDSGFGASDHMSFNRRNVPVLFFFSGLHRDYHRPSDTYEKINAEGAILIASLAGHMAERMNSEVERLEYVEVQEPRQAASGGSGYGAYFGSVPDFRDDLDGVLFADVRPDSPASKAGLQVGDLLVGFDGKPVQNIYDFTYALGTKRPGDMVAVVVRRNGQDIRVNVTLEERR